MKKNQLIGLNRDVIKYIAMFTMLLNHIAHLFLPADSTLGILFTNIGYFTAITMCFFLVEGFSYTHSKKKYGERLLLFACLSQLPFTFILQSTRLNMLFTLFFCFLILVSMNYIRNPFLKTISIIGLILLCTVSDWSWNAALFTILLAKAKDSKSKLILAYFISWLVYFLYGLTNVSLLSSFYASLGIIVSGIVIIFFYNGKRATWGKNFSKWFFYLFYPAHLIVLWTIHLYLF